MIGEIYFDSSPENCLDTRRQENVDLVYFSSITPQLLLDPILFPINIQKETKISLFKNASHPWIQQLATWSSSLSPPLWAVLPLPWPPTVRSPSPIIILWQLANADGRFDEKFQLFPALQIICYDETSDVAFANWSSNQLWHLKTTTQKTWISGGRWRMLVARSQCLNRNAKTLLVYTAV